MTVHIPPGYAQFSIEHWLTGYTRPAVTTMGLKVLGTESPMIKDVAEQAYDVWADAFLPVMDNSITLRNAKAIIGQDGGEPIIQEFAGGGKGASVRESTSPALALMITKRTALGGRKNRGRTYYPWALAESQVDEMGTIAAVGLTAWTTAAAQALAGFDNEAPNSFLGGAYLLHSDPATPPTPITGWIPNPVIRTQTQRQARF